ncbi:hypothetical protein QT711_15345 [Sporosarcina saromensis]|uniref:Uncharacterized protein n=1 Tax=Sporosarcina saromensis TaxID=359365 RepID=A0ABU4GCB4_9BACL|nr:hypothetical protein [Sporosarcina saromensis]MDW0114573.1 hypothetical protein [Sporosarcina saromensis]
MYDPFIMLISFFALHALDQLKVFHHGGFFLSIEFTIYSIGYEKLSIGYVDLSIV